MYKTAEEKDDLHKLLVTWLGICEKSKSETLWRKQATEDYKFFAGDQDTPEVKEELIRQRRPNTTFNEILPKINMLVGMGAQMEGSTTIMPRSSADAPLTELLTGTRDYYTEKMRLHRKQNKVFEHSVKSGRSWLHLYIDVNDSDNILKAQRVPGMFMHTDPDAIEDDVETCRFLFRDKWLDADDIEAAFPEFTFARDSNGHVINTVLTSLPNQNNLPVFFNEANNKHRLVEAWWKKRETVHTFLNPLTHEQDELFEDEFKVFVSQLKKGIELPNNAGTLQQDNLDSVPRFVYSKYTCIMTGTNVLSVQRSPFKHKRYPYVQCVAYHDEENNCYFSVIRNMIDPQRGFNTTRRQLIHLLQTAPKGMLMEEEGSILNKDEYVESGAKPNFILRLVRGGLKKIEFSKQPQISQIYSQLDALFQQSMKDCSGIQDSLMGIQTSTREPGITAKHRFESGVAVLHTLFDNFKEFKYLCSKIILSNIQQYVTEEQLIRIKGNEGYQLVEINSQNGENAGFNDISAGTFDVVVDEDIVTKTTRLAVAELLQTYSQNNPGSIPADLIAEYSNMPYSTLIRIREYEQRNNDIAAEAAEFDRSARTKELAIKEKEVDAKIASLKEKKNDTGN